MFQISLSKPACAFALVALPFAVSGCSRGGEGTSVVPSTIHRSVPKSSGAKSSTTGTPKASLSPTSLGFGVWPRSKSGPAPVVLNNGGTATLTVSKIIAASSGGVGYFSETNNCGVTLAAGAKCTISVTAAAGTFARPGSTFKGTLSVYDNAYGSPQTAALYGRILCVGLRGECYSGHPCCPGLACVPFSTRAYCEPSGVRARQTYLGEIAPRQENRTYMPRFSAWNAISVIDVRRRSVLQTISISAGTSSLAITPDGNKVYVANALTDSVSVIDTHRRTVRTTIAIGFGKRPVDVAIGESGRFAYVSNEEQNGISVIDTVSDTVIKIIRAHSLPADIPILRRCSPGIVASPDGSTAYLVTGDDTMIRDPVYFPDSVLSLIALAT